MLSDSQDQDRQSSGQMDFHSNQGNSLTPELQHLVLIIAGKEDYSYEAVQAVLCFYHRI